jgi:ATP-dependent Zn protease
MDETPTWLTVLVSWMPMLVMIGIWAYITRRIFGRSKSGLSQMEYLEALLAEQKRHNQQIETLVARLSNREPPQPPA